MTSFDTTSKKQVEINPKDFVHLCFEFEATDITVLEIITPEQPTIEMHQADSLIKTIYKGNEVLVHFEFQTTDSYDPEMSLRMAGYIMRAVEAYRLPVYSNVIYLRPDAGKNDPGRYEQNIEHHNISIEYRVFRLIDLDGQKILDSRVIGLIPFTPLMGHPKDIDADQWLRRCMQVANSLDVPNKAAYLGSLAILGNLVYDSQTIQDILEEIMQHAPIVEHMAPLAHEQGKAEGIEQGKAEGIEQGKAEGIEQGKAEGIEQGKAEGIEQGETKAKRDSVIKLLTHQFPDVSDALVEAIHEIQERSRLDTLFDQILSATSFEDIDLNGVGSQGK